MTRANRVYRIAAIAGDGIGKEVMPEGLRVLEAASRMRRPSGMTSLPMPSPAMAAMR